MSDSGLGGGEYNVKECEQEVSSVGGDRKLRCK